MRLVLGDTAATEAFGRELGAELRAGDLVVLTGPLGAGKTTLTRGIADALGVRGRVQSPTFVLARTHPSLRDGPPLVHVDAYRLGGADELFDLDLDFDHSVVVVEWGRGLLDGVSESWLEVEIERALGSRADATGAAAAIQPAETTDPDADHLLGLDDDLDSDEPRVLTVTAHGPRWAGTPYAAPA